MKRSLAVALVAALALVRCATPARTPTTPSTRIETPHHSSRASTSAESSPRLLAAGDIIGMWIKSELDKTVGTVADVLIDPNTGRVTGVIVGLGGVLGVDEKTVVIPWDDLYAGLRMDGPKLTAMMNEAKLEAAPRYEGGASAERDRAPSASPRRPDTRNRRR